MTHFYTHFMQMGNSILIREIRNGIRSKYKFRFKPTLYLKSPNKSSTFKSISGTPLDPMEFDTIADAREFISQYKDTPGYSVYGNPRWAYSAIESQFPSTGPLGIDFDPELINVVFIDIETASGGILGFPNIKLANHAINAITLGFRDKTYSLGIEDVRPGVENNTYIYCRNERELLTKFLELWKQFDPDVVTGWNVMYFDMPYIANRLDVVFDSEDASAALSPWGIIEKKFDDASSLEDEKKKRMLVEIGGIATLDYIQLYKKFRMKMQESYKLDYIAYAELGEKKVDYSEYGSLHELYKSDYEQFIRYNIHDVRLVQRLDQELGYISLTFTIAYLMKTKYADVYSNIRLWDVVIASWLLRQNIVIAANSTREDSDGYEGAFVKDPIIGKFDWVGSFDLTSLYPSIIRSCNISPDVDMFLLEGKSITDYVPELRGMNSDTVMDLDNPHMVRAASVLKEHNLALCANGTLYRRDKKSFLAELMELMFEQRKIAKKKMLSLKREYAAVSQEMKSRGIL